MIDFRKTAAGQIALNALKLDNQRNQILTDIWKDPFVQDFIINLNTESQLRFGKLGNGGDMPQAGPGYLAAKRSLIGTQNAPTELTNLFLTGAFYDTFDIIVSQTGFTIIANTALYGRDFKDIYGFDILGLNDESLQKLINFIEPMFVKEVKRRLFVGI
jgi:hypothetical protein